MMRSSGAIGNSIHIILIDILAKIHSAYDSICSARQTDDRIALQLRTIIMPVGEYDDGMMVVSFRIRYKIDPRSDTIGNCRRSAKTC